MNEKERVLLRRKHNAVSIRLSQCGPLPESVFSWQRPTVEKRRDESMAKTPATHRQLLDELAALRQKVIALEQRENILLQTKELAETAARTKSELLSTLSHELRTPISIILGYIDLLLEGSFGLLTDSQIDPLKRIARNASELSDLILGMLDLSRLDAGQLSVEFQEVHVPQVIAAIQSELEDVCRLSQLEFRWQAAPNLPPVYTDPGKLKTVLKNLVGNAVKFTHQGQVSVDARVGQDGLEIVVSDTGIGIPEESLPLIFEPFYQVENPSTGQLRGTGLGLHIVKRLLETLRGKVSVVSEVGRGSSFCIWLPIKKPAQNPAV